MTTTPATFTDALIHVLETEPRQFVAVAKQANSLPGAPRARDYSEAEIDQLTDQLTSGVIRILLEALRNEDPKFRNMYMEVAIPSFVRQGETPDSLIRWNASYFVLLASALAARVRPEHRNEVFGWVAAFSGLFLAEVLRTASKAGAASGSAVR